jgi:ubiquinone/menaquinone biosynthesis C-methylase UbiE
MSSPDPTALATPELVIQTLTAYQRSAALRAAVDLDLFRAVGEGPGEAAWLARRCGASERGIRILCDYLVTIGLLNKSDGHYQHTPTSATFLDPRSPACMATAARFLDSPAIYEPHVRLTEIIRSGHTVLPGLGTVEPNNPLWVEFAHSMAPIMALMTGPFAELVLEGLSGPLRVLDIAAGHGLFGIEIAKRNPQAQVTAVDWAPVLEVAQDNARRAGVDRRYALLPGSAFDVTFTGPFDVVLLTNFLHHFDPPTCVTLLKKVQAALKPGGRAATLEFVPNDDRVSPPVPAGFSLMMLVTTVNGDAYTFREMESMYQQAGFERITAHPMPAGPHTAVTGRRPAL